MGRPLSAEFMAALAARELRAAVFVEATFATGAIYVWTGLGQITWGGHTWQGLGTLASVSAIEEGSSVEARGITLGLSGINVDLLHLVVEEFSTNQPALVYFGLFREDGTLIPDPVLSWAGRMDQPSIEVNGETASISINCENRLVEMNVAVDRRYTNEDQQLDYPGDRGLEFVPSIQEITIYWGRTPNQANNL